MRRGVPFRVDPARAGPVSASAPAENRRIAQRLREAAGLLRTQGASPYRVNAYRHAAESIAGWPRDVAAIFASDGVRGLDAIPGVGLGIAAAVAEMVTTGRWSQLDRLRGRAGPEELLRSVPGIGPGLAHRVHEALNVDSLEALEAAAHDGRLEALRGVGPRRAAAWRATLGEMLGRGPRERAIVYAPTSPGLEPPVESILDVDREYRERAAAGTLELIAPRRMNPEGRAWLPVLHAQRGAWHFTALFSNTPLAHRLGRVHDWVVVYFYDGDHVERQRTVVTEPRGPLAGRRVVRGREPECLDHNPLH